MHYEQMQKLIEILAEETRNAGYEYSADMLNIAAVSLRKEAVLSEQFSLDHGTAIH